MREPTDEIKLCVLFLLHRGLVEIRLLTGENKSRQAFDLADSLEVIPGMLKNWHEGAFNQIRLLFDTYQKKYPGEGFDFLSRLDDGNALPF